MLYGQTKVHALGRSVGHVHRSVVTHDNVFECRTVDVRNALDGEMLKSFVGEIGNMVAGNAASELSDKGLNINISPPTVIVGSTKTAGFEQGIQIPLELKDLGSMNVFLITEGRAK